jgi:hypothetical protein
MCVSKPPCHKTLWEKVAGEGKSKCGYNINKLNKKIKMVCVEEALRLLN